MLEREETGSRFGPRRPLVMGIGCGPQIRCRTIVTAILVKRGECSMNAIIRTAATVVALLALAGCAGMEYEEAEMSSAPGDAYQRDLHDEYVRLSKSEFDQGDYTDSDRSEESRVGKACVSRFKYRWVRVH